MSAPGGGLSFVGYRPVGLGAQFGGVPVEVTALQSGRPVALDEQQPDAVGKQCPRVEQPVEDALPQVELGTAGRVLLPVVGEQRASHVNHERVAALFDGYGGAPSRVRAPSRK